MNTFENPDLACQTSNGKEPSNSITPDEVVVQGAALHASSLENAEGASTTPVPQMGSFVN
jgi:molecular chaperone DnaK (HSP70)